MPKIGIFWIYQGKILGKARDLAEGESSVLGLIDSPDNHIDLWEGDLDFLALFPELRDQEYQQVPRGRVMYASHENKAVVYMDKSLYQTKTAKQLVIDFFALHAVNVSWKTDPHYTTDQDELDDVFGVG
jgi:hypothetical protein